ncbi:coiled-coil domain-containing protein 89 [Latimeria chalumnae]|uniref:coiled-coil domain-containing protein 89 n=1 Tax=Latimeria chalumnae TaxID=7897 RepID=UPI00313B15B1
MSEDEKKITGMASHCRTTRKIGKKGFDNTQEISDVQATLEKLKGLSQDDKTENAMLRSRIDEQSQLICILKQRADEMFFRCQTLERINTELESLQEDVKNQLKTERKQSARIEQRFMDLAANHQEMIKFKDEYKGQNIELREENDYLRHQNDSLFCRPLKEKEEIICQLTEDIKKLSEEYTLLSQKYKYSLLSESKGVESLVDSYNFALSTNLDLLAPLHTRLERPSHRAPWFNGDLRVMQASGRRLERRWREAERKLKEATEKKMMEESNHLHELQKISKEKEELLELTMQRGKIIQEKQKEIKHLEEKIKSIERDKKAIEERYEFESSTVNANLKVKALYLKVEESQQAYNKLKKVCINT